jgi:hypothetical protein
MAGGIDVEQWGKPSSLLYKPGQIPKFSRIYGDFQNIEFPLQTKICHLPAQNRLHTGALRVGWILRAVDLPVPRIRRAPISLILAANLSIPRFPTLLQKPVLLFLAIRTPARLLPLPQPRMGFETPVTKPTGSVTRHILSSSFGDPLLLKDQIVTGLRPMRYWGEFIFGISRLFSNFCMELPRRRTHSQNGGERV